MSKNKAQKTRKKQVKKQNASGIEGAEFELKEGNYDRSIKKFSGIINNSPKNSKALKGRALGFLKTRQYDKAIIDLQQSLQVNATDADSYDRLVRVYLELDDHQKAQEIAELGAAKCQGNEHLESLHRQLSHPLNSVLNALTGELDNSGASLGNLLLKFNSEGIPVVTARNAISVSPI